MTLADYLAQPEKTASALATELGCATSTITRAARGEITPSRELMIDIFNKTGGLVTPNDFMGIAA